MRYETFLLAIVMSEYGTQNVWPGSSNGSFRLASFLLLFPSRLLGFFVRFLVARLRSCNGTRKHHLNSCWS